MPSPTDGRGWRRLTRQLLPCKKRRGRVYKPRSWPKPLHQATGVPTDEGPIVAEHDVVGAHVIQPEA